MGIKERKEKEKKDLKKKILDAAEKIFMEGGFEDLSMRKIAKIIDYSPTTIYRYFENKHDILNAITDKIHSDLSEQFKKINIDESIDSLSKLKKLIYKYIMFGIKNPNVYRLYVEVAKLEVIDDIMYEIIGGKRYRIFYIWQNLIEDMIKKDEIIIKDSISLILIIWSLTDGFILNRIKHNNLPWNSYNEDINNIIEMIFNGVLTKNNK